MGLLVGWWAGLLLHPRKVESDGARPHHGVVATRLKRVVGAEPCFPPIHLDGVFGGGIVVDGHFEQFLARLRVGDEPEPHAGGLDIAC